MRLARKTNNINGKSIIKNQEIHEISKNINFNINFHEC
jgi:hypothetical protein